MALTERQINRFINKIDDFLEDFDGAVFNFGDVRIKIFEPQVGDENVSVTFKVTADAEDQGDIQRILNGINRALDGDVDRDNPRIRFDDETPNTELRISDTFRLEFNKGSGLDLIDV